MVTRRGVMAMHRDLLKQQKRRGETRPFRQIKTPNSAFSSFALRPAMEIRSYSPSAQDRVDGGRCTVAPRRQSPEKPRQNRPSRDAATEFARDGKRSGCVSRRQGRTNSGMRDVVSLDDKLFTEIPAAAARAIDLAKTSKTARVGRIDRSNLQSTSVLRL
jgi:hypothetical protein